MKQCTCYALRAVDCTCKPAKYGELYTSPTAKQEQGEPLPDFYITERTADSIYKLKSRDWALCISGNKGPTMHKNIPVFVGYIKTKPVEQEQGEPYGYLKLNTGRFFNEVEGLNPMTDKRYLPLYTTPQQRKPLTDEQMWNLWNSQGSDDMTQKEAIAFARAIEAAHGIKE